MGDKQQTRANLGEPPSISLSDLAHLLTVINLASGRGTFRAAELSQVGQLYYRLRRFLALSAQP